MRSKELKWSFSGVLKPEYCNLKHSFKLTFRIKTPIKSSLFSYKIYKYRSWINNINILQEQSILPVSYWSCSILSGKSCWQPALTVLLQETELCLHSKSTVEMVKPRGFLYAVQVISLKHLMSQLGDGETFFFFVNSYFCFNILSCCTTVSCTYQQRNATGQLQPVVTIHRGFSVGIKDTQWGWSSSAQKRKQWWPGPERGCCCRRWRKLLPHSLQLRFSSTGS